MAESAPTTPVKKTPTKKAMAPKAKSDSAKKPSSATKKHPSFDEMVKSAVSELTKRTNKGSSYFGVIKYITKRYELPDKNHKKTLTSIRSALEILIKSGDITTKEDTTGFASNQRFKLSDALKKQVRDAEKKQNAKDTEGKVSLS